MASNFTEFSEGIGRITPEERGWIERQLDADRWESEASEWDAPVDEGDPGFDWEMQPGEEGQEGQFLWIYSLQEGRPEYAARFVRGFLAKFRPDDCFCLTYSTRCTSPRIGHFAGGAIFVTARGYREGHAFDWVNRKMDEYHRATDAKGRIPRGPGGEGDPAGGGPEPVRGSIFEEDGVVFDSERDSFCVEFH